MTRTDQRIKKIHDVLKHRQTDLTIVMENIHDPHNVSAMLRSADAVGVAEVQLVYTHESFPKIGTKSSASASKWVPRRRFASIGECYTQLRGEGFRIYATHLGTESQPIYSVDLTQPVALVFGNEHRGVSAEAARLADGNVLIPMVGMIQSLNVSVACAVSLYEAFRQRLKAGHYSNRKMTKLQFDALLQEWLKK